MLLSMNQRAATLFFTPLCLYGGGDQEEARDSDDLIDGLIFISLCSFLGNWRNRIRLDLLMFQPLFRLSVCFELPCVTALIIKISDSAYHGAFVSQFFSIIIAGGKLAAFCGHPTVSGS